MTGTIAQCIALVAYGNDYLRNGKIPADFYATNTVFQFCNKVDFRETKKCFLLIPKIIARNPIRWFEYLKVNDCKCLRLHFDYSRDQNNVRYFEKDYRMAMFADGGGTWFIESIYDNYSDYWESQWKVARDLNVPDQKIWVVNYKRVIGKQHMTNLQIANDQIKNMLRQTLTEISNFAFKQNLQGAGKQFDKAKITLDSSSPEESSYFGNDLLPLDSYSMTARQILFAADIAWVFTGMGSWIDNEYGFSEEDRNDYDRLSKQLYSNIIEAVIAATNSY